MIATLPRHRLALPLALPLALALVLSGLAAPRAEAASGTAVLAGQSAHPTVDAGGTLTLAVFFQNTGTEPWVLRSGTQVDLASCAGTACGVPDATLAGWDPGTWPAPGRYATQRQPSVPPRGIATFHVVLRVPQAASGSVTLRGEVVVAGSGQRLSTSGYAHEITVRPSLPPLEPLLLGSHEVGPGFRVERTATLSLTEYAEDFDDPKAAAAALRERGFLGAILRDHRRSGPDEPWSVRQLLVRYASAAGASAGLAAARRGHAGDAPASLPEGGEETASWLAAEALADGTPAARASVGVRVGATVAFLHVRSGEGHMANELLEDLIAAQAARLAWAAPRAPPADPSAFGAASRFGRTFLRSAGHGRDLHVDVLLAPSVAAAIRAQVDEDVAALTRFYGLALPTPVEIFVLADARGFERTLVALGVAEEEAEDLAARAAGVHLTRRAVVVVNWERGGRALPYPVLRHELSHHFVNRLVGYPRVAVLPEWLDEGLARSLEQTYGRVGWNTLIDRYVVAGAARASRLPSLARLAEYEDFHDREADPVLHYAYSGHAVSALLNLAGREGVLALLRRVAAGGPVATALREVAGLDEAALDRAAGASARRLDARRGLALTQDTPGGPGGLSGVAFGAAPGAAVSFVVSGAGEAAFTKVADRHGSAQFWFAPAGLRPGSYRISATDGAWSVTRTVAVRGARALADGPPATLVPLDVPERPLVLRLR